MRLIIKTTTTEIYPNCLSNMSRAAGKITGDEGLRIILNGNDVGELGINERLTFEL